MEMHPPIPVVVTLSSLVCEKCKPVEVEDQKAVHFSTSTDEEAVLKEKLAGVLKDVMKTKLVPELEDEKFQSPEEFNPLSLVPPQPYRNRKPG